MSKVLVKDFGRGALKVYHDGARNKWLWYLRDNEGRQLRRDLPATTKAQAVKIAEKINNDHLSGVGYLPGVDSGGHTVAEALIEAINAKQPSANDTTRKDYARRAQPFAEWLSVAKPKVKRWGDVSTKVIRDYLADLLSCANGQTGQVLSHDGVRMRLFVVKMTSRYMAETYPDRYGEVAKPVGLKRARRFAREKEDGRALDGESLRAFLAFARERRPDLYGIALLQSMAGLRMMEAASLRDADVAFASSTIRVTDTPHHSVKTDYSDRGLPVCGAVLEMLRGAIANAKVRHAEGYIFLTRHQEPWGRYGLPHAMKQLFQECWQKRGIEAFRDFQPHWLRATFATLVRRQRADARVLAVYLGQCPRDVLGAHYERVGLDQMQSEIVPAIEAAMNQEGVGKLSGIQTNRAKDVQ